MRKRACQIVFLLAVVGALVVPGWAREGAQQEQVAKKYPPYPDVWAYRDPKGLGHLCKAEDGDFYLISSAFKKASTGSTYRSITALFGRSVIEVSSKEADEVRGDRKPLGGVGVLRCYGLNDYPQSLTLRKGFTVRQACFHSQGLCDYPYFTTGLEVRDKDQRIVERKIFLYQLKELSKKYLPAPKVVDIAGEIMEQVNQLEPKLVPLEDETFLVVAGGVFRFDEQLKARFPINEDRLFMIEPSLIEAIYKQADQSTEPGTLAWHQAVQDAVAELLEKLRKEKRP